jgi:hypothetical protein
VTLFVTASEKSNSEPPLADVNHPLSVWPSQVETGSVTCSPDLTDWLGTLEPPFESNVTVQVFDSSEPPLPFINTKARRL